MTFLLQRLGRVLALMHLVVLSVWRVCPRAGCGIIAALGEVLVPHLMRKRLRALASTYSACVIYHIDVRM